MALITAADLRADLGLSADNPDDVKTAARLHAVALAAVNGYAPGAADDLKNEAIIRTAAYLHSDDPAVRPLRRMEVGEAVNLEPRAPGSALRLSGAAALLSPYRVRRAVRAEVTA